MGHEQPFLYAAPQSQRSSQPYSDFNPRASSQAAYQILVERSIPKPKQEGPLINFNRHPDSYMPVSGQRAPVTPMPPNTKKKVTTLRWLQFALRVITSLCAIGLLVATICVTNTSGIMTYLLRIPAAWDSIISLYAVYHLIRPARSRPPASSASYHFFALFMDAGLIPFYVYVAMAAYINNQLPPTNPTRWNSFFSGNAVLNDICFSIFAGAVGVGGMHLISIFFDIWLIKIFRDINNLPPDMNPLEDNLTSRRATKHKHKNSELTLYTNASSFDLDEKHSAYLSGSTLNIDDQSRLSMLKDTSFAETKALPFAHSRKGSELDFSPHTPETAQWSRHQFDGQQNLYREAVTSPKRSRYEVRPDGKLDIKRRTPGAHNTTSMTSTNQDDTSYAVRNAESPARFSRASTQIGVALSTDPSRAEQREYLMKVNWYVLDDDENHEDDTPRKSALGRAISRHDYALVHERYESCLPESDRSSQQDPLKMNPPTPPPDEDMTLQPRKTPRISKYEFEPEPTPEEATIARSTTIKSNSSSIYSESVPALTARAKNTTPKGKYYGNLAAATFAVRGGQGSPAQRTYGLPSPVVSRSPSPPKHDPQARVVSRTGADIADETPQWQDHSQSPYGMRSRRDVSGKIAEEGRGGHLQHASWHEQRMYR